MENAHKLKNGLRIGLEVVGGLSLLALCAGSVIKSETRQTVPISGVTNHVEVVKQRSPFGLRNQDYVAVDGEFLGDISRFSFQYDVSNKVEQCTDGSYVAVPGEPYFSNSQ